MTHPMYFEVDGLTRDGTVIPERVRAVRELISDGVAVVLWSGSGPTAARQFAEMNGLDVVATAGKPSFCKVLDRQVWDNLRIHTQ